MRRAGTKCEARCAVIVDPNQHPGWKKATHDWSTVCNWGACHGCTPHCPGPNVSATQQSATQQSLGRGLGDDGDAGVHLPLEGDLRPSLAVLLADRGDEVARDELGVVARVVAPEPGVATSCHVSDAGLAEHARHAARREAELADFYRGDARSTPPWPARQGSLRSIWDWFTPAMPCPGLLRRVGPLGDGGKWICLDRTLVRAGNAAIVYSIGVKDDVRFEAAVMSSLGIHQVYAFDHTIESPPSLPPGVQGQLHFERVGLGAVEGGQNTTTLGALMRTRGHARVHLLKVACEGCEWKVVLALLERMQGGLDGVEQLLIELHFGTPDGSFTEEDTDLVFRLFRALERAGLVAFHSEPNLYGPAVRGIAPRSIEYSFVRAAAPGALYLPHLTSDHNVGWDAQGGAALQKVRVANSVRGCLVRVLGKRCPHKLGYAGQNGDGWMARTRAVSLEYQQADLPEFNYSVFRWPGTQHFFRGPAWDMRSCEVPCATREGLHARVPYLAFIGAAQTFGRGVRRPYPARVGSALGLPWLNLGQGGAGPAYFHKQFIVQTLARADIVFINSFSARSVDVHIPNGSIFRSDGGARI